MVDFKKKLQEELKRVNSQSNSNNNNEEHMLKRKAQQLVYLNRNKPFFGRILPLGDQWFASLSKRVQITLKKKSGSEYTINAVIDTDDPEDKLAVLIKKAIHYNYQYRQDHPEVGDAYDAIALNKQSYGNMGPSTRIQNRAEFIGISLVTDGEGNTSMESGPNGPIIHNYSVSGSVYNSLLDLMADKTYRIEGQPFQDSLGFVTARKTFPIQAKLESNKWVVTPREGIVIPAMTYNYLEKTPDGKNYVYFDDPYLFNKPLKETNPSFYDYVVEQTTTIIKNRLEELKNKEAGYQQNPYGDNAPTSQKVTTTTTTTHKEVEDKEIIPEAEPLPWEVNDGAVPSNPGKVEEDEQAPSSETPAEPETTEQVDLPKSNETDLGDNMTTDKELNDIINNL